MTYGVVIPVGPGRDSNLKLCLRSLYNQSRPPDAILIIEDGPALEHELEGPDEWKDAVFSIRAPKHQPGMEQPRNIGLRWLAEFLPLDYVWFVDSDVVLCEHALESIETEMDRAEPRVLICPYEWMPRGRRPRGEDELPWELHNDPRTAMFDSHRPGGAYRDDLAAGLACFSGNLVWPVTEFQRSGGFWSELHHGRCEDGELGLRAVAMGIPIGACRAARGFHLWHTVNPSLIAQRNKRDVPLINERHPWVQEGGMVVVDRDGKSFDVDCATCGERVPTGDWWSHADLEGHAAEVLVR